MNTKTKKMAFIALMTAVISVLAPVSMPLAGEVPISLATFAIMLAGVLLGSKNGAAAASLYLILGAIGVPVFAGYTSGAGILFGVTGGYLFGYIPLAFFSGFFCERAKESSRIPAAVGGMLLGTFVLYFLGTVWFINVTQMDLNGAMLACVIPFLPGDLIKIAAVTVLAPQMDRVPALHNLRTAEGH